MARSPKDEKNKTAQEPDVPDTGPATRRVPPNQVSFDTSDLKSTYCNVCNGSSTQEEVVINFGVNDSWDMGQDKLKVHLHHRIVMSPHAAKRLRDMMNRLIDEHETRYGTLGGG